MPSATYLPAARLDTWGENGSQLPSEPMIAALRNRNYDEFAQLLEEKSDENNVESEEVSAEVSAALQSLRAAVYGARGAIGSSSSIKAIIKCINVFSSSIMISNVRAKHGERSSTYLLAFVSHHFSAINKVVTIGRTGNGESDRDHEHGAKQKRDQLILIGRRCRT